MYSIGIFNDFFHIKSIVKLKFLRMNDTLIFLKRILRLRLCNWD